MTKQPQSTDVGATDVESAGASRRNMLKQLAAGSVALGVAGPSLLLSGCAATAPQTPATDDATANNAAAPLKGRVRHSVASWTYGHLSIGH